jgi:hypothetical protein
MEAWMADDDVMNTVKELISNHHPDLVQVEEEIVEVHHRDRRQRVGIAQQSSAGRPARPSPLRLPHGDG